MLAQFRLLPLVAILVLPDSALAQIPLPTPKEHYEDFNLQAETFRLAASVLPTLDAETQQEVGALMAALRSGDSDGLTAPRLRQLLQRIDWQRWRPQLLELALHRSAVLSLVSEDAQEWVPIVHDALLFFLDNLSEERIIERLVAQARLPAGTERGQRLLQFASRTPSLQKIGQILARYPAVPEDLRQSLQTLENSIQTTTRDELVEFIRQQVGPERIERYQIEFAEEVLAEASIGAVIRSRLTLPGEDDPRQAVCKVIKSYAVPALNEDLEIMNGLTLYFEENADFYEIGDIPLAEMFQEVREALSREILVTEEQQNLIRAAEYYREDPKVKIPEIYPASTENVTFMEFIEGGKITDAFPGNRQARRRMARRLADILSVDVLFSSRDPALFHGDPHAGNVFYTSSDSANPYRIALIDWGLAGVLNKQQRVQLIQLLLGVYLRDRGRLRRNLGALIGEGQPLNAQGQRKTDALVAETLSASRGKPAFSVLSDLISRLARAGYRINFNLALYIKSQITIIGILKELDPDLKMTERATRHVGGQVLKEMPKRLANMIYFPNWDSRNYPSLVSNDDVFDVQATLIKRGFKKLGGWMWKGIRAPFR